MKPQELAFNNCTLAILEDTFDLRKENTNNELTTWLSAQIELSPYEQEMVKIAANALTDNVAHWNEQDLSLHYIGPMFLFANFTVPYRFNLFAQINIEATLNDIRLFGRVDELVASGFRSPKIPFFAFNEYKRQTDPNGDPAGQCLAAMLAGQTLNSSNSTQTMYGCFVIGSTWNFMVLEGKQYTISNSLDGRDINDALQILRILKALKQICTARTQV